MIIDYVEISVKAGKGGNGKTSFRRNRKGSDGGNGGKGGDVYFVAKKDLKLLNQFSHETKIAAEDGVSGESNQRTGRDGQDLIVYLPIGTSVTDAKTDQVICEMETLDEPILMARGGKGGRGNWEFRTNNNIDPAFSERGTKGEKLRLKLSLKLIADYGLIGLPNAGKSSLLNELTGAHAKTADYPFTTLTAALGSYKGRIIADIPGLIEGASQGKGLGIGFLKHIEKVKVLLHCISLESDDVLKDYEIIRKELENFNPKLLEKKEIVVLTKTDLVDEKIIQKTTKKLEKIGKTVISTSIHDLDKLNVLTNLLS